MLPISHTVLLKLIPVFVNMQNKTILITNQRWNEQEYYISNLQNDSVEYRVWLKKSQGYCVLFSFSNM